MSGWHQVSILFGIGTAGTMTLEPCHAHSGTIAAARQALCISQTIIPPPPLGCTFPRIWGKPDRPTHPSSALPPP